MGKLERMAREAMEATDGLGVWSGAGVEVAKVGVVAVVVAVVVVGERSEGNARKA